MVCRLLAGASGIRTVGPLSKRVGFSAALIEIFSRTARPTAKPPALRVRIRLAPALSHANPIICRRQSSRRAAEVPAVSVVHDATLLRAIATRWPDRTAEDAEATQSARYLRAHRSILRALCGEVFLLNGDRAPHLGILPRASRRYARRSHRCREPPIRERMVRFGVFAVGLSRSPLACHLPDSGLKLTCQVRESRAQRQRDSVECFR
jgi:hypothetical protein